MLTKQLAIAEFSNGLVLPDRLTRRTHAHYEQYAQSMLLAYRHGVGLTRRQLHQAVHNIFANEDECPIRRIDAFCKLLDDVSEYDRDRKGDAARLRRRVFRLSAGRHPLVRLPDRLFEHDEWKTKQGIAAQIGRPWSDIEQDLFKDVMEFHRLVQFRGYPSPQAFLARYNVAQVQVALFDAIQMTVHASRDFKSILRYAKLARLMHVIRRTAPGSYEIKFSGPASVLRETRRYGVAMARFLPALLSCRGWSMNVLLRSRRQGWYNRLQLAPSDGLSSHLADPVEFDSRVEENFATKWGTEPREGWTLVREGAVLHSHQKVFVPDFLFRHEAGDAVFLEIVGFWTPEYIAEKSHTLKLFQKYKILLAVSQHVGQALPDLAGLKTVMYKSALGVADVLAQLRSFLTTKPNPPASPPDS